MQSQTTLLSRLKHLRNIRRLSRGQESSDRTAICPSSVDDEFDDSDEEMGQLLSSATIRNGELCKSFCWCSNVYLERLSLCLIL